MSKYLTSQNATQQVEQSKSRASVHDDRRWLHVFVFTLWQRSSVIFFSHYLEVAWINTGIADLPKVITNPSTDWAWRQSIDQPYYFIVRLKVDQRAGQLSLPHLGITKKEKKET